MIPPGSTLRRRCPRPRAILLFLACLLALPAAAAAAPTTVLPRPPSAPADVASTIALKGRRVGLTNLRQSATLYADDVTSFAVARGAVSENDASVVRVVRLRLRVKNTGSAASLPAPFGISGGNGAAVPPVPALAAALATQSEAGPPKPVAPQRVALRAHFFLLSSPEIQSASAYVLDSPYALALPLPRLMDLTARELPQ